MNQLSLFPPQEPRPTGFGLFLAVFPDEHTAHHICELATKLRHQHKLRGRVRPLNHLHISLPCLDDVSGEQGRVIQLVDCACKAITDITPSFEVTFSQVLSFKRKASDHPLVLVGSKDGNAELKALQRFLAGNLSNRRSAKPTFTPHITMLYDREITEESISPVSWKVNEVVLVRSHVGATKYDRLERWALGG